MACIVLIRKTSFHRCNKAQNRGSAILPDAKRNVYKILVYLKCGFLLLLGQVTGVGAEESPEDVPTMKDGMVGDEGLEPPTSSV